MSDPMLSACRSTKRYDQTIACGTKTLILDQPTRALGANERCKVLDFDWGIPKGGTPMLLILHNTPHVFEVAA